MSADPNAQLAALESRVAALEHQLRDLIAQGAVADDIPWMPIAAAIAAVFPDSRIVGIEQIQPREPRNRWGLIGRMILIQSHGVR